MKSVSYKQSAPRPCAECPFAKRAFKGWLGPYADVVELHRAGTAESGFPCHCDVNAQRAEGKDSIEADLEARQCAGALIYAAKAAKLFRNPALAARSAELSAGTANELVVEDGFFGLSRLHESLLCVGCNAHDAWLREDGGAYCRRCKPTKLRGAE